MTTIDARGDLVYCIRAGAIDDVGLMEAVSIDEMVEFFFYTKAVNAAAADLRSEATDKLVTIITCNDLAGVKLVGGSADFRKALSTSSNKASQVFADSRSGPALLLNLPKLLSALVKLFTPLFPDRVKERLKFVQGPLKDVTDMKQIATSSKSPQRAKFINNWKKCWHDSSRSKDSQMHAWSNNDRTIDNICFLPSATAASLQEDHLSASGISKRFHHAWSAN